MLMETATLLASFPGLHAQLLLLAVRKAGGRTGQIYHVMRTAADVMFSLLTSGFVLSPLFFPRIQLILSVQFVLQVRLLLDRSWLATVCDVCSGTHRGSRDKSFQAFPLLLYCKWQKLGVEAWERGYYTPSTSYWLCATGVQTECCLEHKDATEQLFQIEFYTFNIHSSYDC